MKQVLKQIAYSPLLQWLCRVLLRISLKGLSFKSDSRNRVVYQELIRACIRILRNASDQDNHDIVLISGERGALLFIKERLGSQPIVFDVGANQGQYSNLVLSIMPGASVYSFEPSSSTFAILLKNIGQHENVHLFNYGLGNTAGRTILYSDIVGSGLASVYPRNLEHFGKRLERKEEVVLTTLDEFCFEHSISAIDFLKLDVEGNEYDVLLGAKRMIDSASIACIQFEFGGCNIDSRTYFQNFFYLLNPKYHLFRLLPSALLPVQSYREEEEVFMTTNYLALLRKRFDGCNQQLRFEMRV